MNPRAALAKEVAPFERLRKPISFMLAFGLFAGVLLSVPQGFRSVPYEAIELSGMILLGLAALGRIWCLLYIAGRKDKELCSSGPYSLCRNPLYLFSFVGVIGFFMAAQSILLGIVACALFLLYYRGVILSEESRLRELFGASYDSYMQRTPRFWPRSLNVDSPGQIVVSPRIIERGLRETVWFLVAIAAADGIELLHRQSNIWHITLPF